MKRAKPDAPYWGETTCEHGSCQKKAYYSATEHYDLGAGWADLETQYLCGVHSCWMDVRNELKKNPDAGRMRDQLNKMHDLQCRQAADKNKDVGARGTVACAKMRMRQKVELVPGFLNVFPNRRHANRKDGLGCATLSPMKLGPVDHQQPDVVFCHSLENFHQFNKVFTCEIDDDAPTDSWRGRRDGGYKDTEPHRHKLLRSHTQKCKCRPLYSVVVDLEGKERRFTYVESRYFYCVHYELLTRGNLELVMLRKLMESGHNLRIVGYDGHDLDEGKTEYDWYLDESAPFGHEMVLYALLTRDGDAEYPWRRYRREHPDVYAGFPMFG